MTKREKLNFKTRIDDYDFDVQLSCTVRFRSSKEQHCLTPLTKEPVIRYEVTNHEMDPLGIVSKCEMFEDKDLYEYLSRVIDEHNEFITQI